ncbi:hypothetical protein C7G80_18320 [Acinetobacter nosocomialis]|nr:hypothetical protein C7G80_18320 [Acinetobacter nosocomialis]
MPIEVSSGLTCFSDQARAWAFNTSLFLKACNQRKKNLFDPFNKNLLQKLWKFLRNAVFYLLINTMDKSA